MAMQAACALQQQVHWRQVRQQEVKVQIQTLFGHLGGNQQGALRTLATGVGRAKRGQGGLFFFPTLFCWITGMKQLQHGVVWHPLTQQLE